MRFQVVAASVLCLMMAMTAPSDTRAMDVSPMVAKITPSGSGSSYRLTVRNTATAPATVEIEVYRMQVDENGVRSFRVGQQFPSGQMPWYMMVVWYANQHSAFLAILGLLFATVIGLSLYALLKKRAHKRLNPQDDGK